VSIDIKLHDPSVWLLAEQTPADRHPAGLYLAGRAPRSRDEARRALDTIAGLLTQGQATADTLAWQLLRDEHVEAIRAALDHRHSPSETTKMLAALRGVLKHCRRLGLISEEAYRRGHAAASKAQHVSRGELRSVFESCTDEGPPSAERAGAVRTLLYGNGARQGQSTTQGQTMMGVSDPRVPAPSARGNAMSMVQLHLRSVSPREAIAHALWEAGACLRSSAFCACLAMLRKALDLWSLDYRAQRGVDGEERAGDAGDLTTRLTKIAVENRLYSATIATILDALNCDEGWAGGDLSARGLSRGTGPSPHGGIVCRGGYASSHDGYAVSRIKEAYRALHEQVLTLITATTPELPL
jgi:hypothetical protein